MASLKSGKHASNLHLWYYPYTEELTIFLCFSFLEFDGMIVFTRDLIQIQVQIQI